MTSTKRFAINYLKAVEKKNFQFFTDNNLDIMDCVELKGTELVSVHVISSLLPPEIVFEIETMFWK